MIPLGNCGKQFVGELTKLLSAFADTSSHELFAVKAALTLPTLLLQKPHSESKTRDHISYLQPCLFLLEKGKIQELLGEGRLIEYHYRSSFGQHPNKDAETIAHSFSKLMFAGRVRAPIYLLLLNAHLGLLSLNGIIQNNPSNPNGRTVCEILEERHPKASPIHFETIVPKQAEDNFHPVIFSKLTPDLVQKRAL